MPISSIVNTIAQALTRSGWALVWMRRSTFTKLSAEARTGERPPADPGRREDQRNADGAGADRADHAHALARVHDATAVELGWDRARMRVHGGAFGRLSCRSRTLSPCTARRRRPSRRSSATAAGEEMALNDRYLNPQMGRILRTLGFDKVWRGGEGAHLIDADGERYLDLFGGYGVFAIGRNHPEAIAAVQEVMAARTGNLPQLGVTLLSGVLAEQLLARAPDSVAAMVPANTGHRGGRGGDQDRPRGHRAPARALRRARLPRADARRALAQRQRRVPRGLRAAAARLRRRAPSATSTRWSASSRAATWRRSSSSRCRARASTCRRRTTCPAPRRCAARRGRCSCATRCRPASGAPGASSRSSTGACSPTWSASPRRSPAGSSRSARCSSRARRVRRGVRRHGARRAPRLDVRRQRPRRGRRAGHAARARPRGPRRARRAARRAAAGADPAAGRALRGRHARCAASG